MSQAGLHADLAELIRLRGRARELAAAHPRRSHEPRGGLRHSPFRGRGMEYAESRPYAPGDDVRHIDWRVSARTGRVHTKLFQAERERVSGIVFDTAPSMRFGTRRCFKSVQAARLAALFAWLAHGDGDRLCAAACGSVSGLCRPAGGRRGVLPLLDALDRWQRPDRADGTAVALATALESLARLLRPGSHLLLLLDPRSVDAAALQVLGRLRAHHDLAACLLTDPFELGLPPIARYPVSDGRERQVLALDEPELRARWHGHYATLLQRVRDDLQRSGVRARWVRTDEDPVAALRALLRGERQQDAA